MQLLQNALGITKDKITLADLWNEKGNLIAFHDPDPLVFFTQNNIQLKHLSKWQDNEKKLIKDAFIYLIEKLHDRYFAKKICIYDIDFDAYPDLEGIPDTSKFLLVWHIFENITRRNFALNAIKLRTSRSFRCISTDLDILLETNIEYITNIAFPVPFYSNIMSKFSETNVTKGLDDLQKYSCQVLVVANILLIQVFDLFNLNPTSKLGKPTILEATKEVLFREDFLDDNQQQLLREISYM